MLLDEPMSNLDAQLRDQLRPELRALLHRAGHPVIHVTHDQQEAMGLADRIAVLEGGVLQQVGTPQELYHRPANLFVARFLGRPGINLLSGEAGVQLGIRPEQLRLVESGGLPARLLRREWQGSQQLLWLDTSRGELLLLAEASLSPGEQLQVSWRPEDELRFSSASGERLA
jgi:multiple sugar transport system ATP-binding protein